MLAPFKAVGEHWEDATQRVLSTYIVESRVSIIGITIMVWVSVPHIGTWDPLGNRDPAD